MSRPGTRRLFAAVVGLLAVAAGASGCTAVDTVSGHLAGLTTKPKVGDCWTTTFAQAQKTEDWEGTRAISCAKPHQTYTYAVTRLGTRFSYKSWLTSGHTIRTDVDRAAYSACLVQQKKRLPGITTKEALLYPSYYLPSTSLWGVGARWVRCDITEIKVGSTIAEPQLTDLPSFATLVSTLESTPAKFALCEDDPVSNGPDGDQTTYADCTGSSDYTFVKALTMVGADGAKYPGLAALTKVGAAQCATLGLPKGHLVIAEPPAKLDWTKYGDRQLDCWLNNN